jgi:glucokinase
VDSAGKVLEREVRPTDITSEEALLAELDDLIETLLRSRPAAIGVGIPSTIDQRAGRVVYSTNIPLGDISLADHLTTRFGIPAAIENDANCAALAEHRFGVAESTRHMLMLTLGTGVGGGIIVDGRLYRGAVGAAGELGHITIDAGGPPCLGNCPGRGHLEALASGTAADRLARGLAQERPDGDLGRASAQGKTPDARLAVELARAGAGDAREVLETTGFYLGLGIASFVNIFNPEVVVVGGGFAAAGDLILAPARRVVAETALAPHRDLVRVLPARLEEAGLIGAGLVGFEALEAAA